MLHMSTPAVTGSVRSRTYSQTRFELVNFVRFVDRRRYRYRYRQVAAPPHAAASYAYRQAHWYLAHRTPCGVTDSPPDERAAARSGRVRCTGVGPDSARQRDCFMLAEFQRGLAQALLCFACAGLCVGVLSCGLPGATRSCVRCTSHRYTSTAELGGSSGSAAMYALSSSSRLIHGAEASGTTPHYLHYVLPDTSQGLWELSLTAACFWRQQHRILLKYPNSARALFARSACLN